MEEIRRWLDALDMSLETLPADASDNQKLALFRLFVAKINDAAAVKTRGPRKKKEEEEPATAAE